jgi:CubicO group peptidase (beta-lactamase class C family)
LEEPAPNTFGAGAGAVVSTADDMAHWLIVHANGGGAADGTRLLSAHSLRELQTASAPSGANVGVLALGFAFPKIAGHLVGGRDVSWLAARTVGPLSSPSCWQPMITSAVSLVATVWQLTGSIERRKPYRQTRNGRVPSP